MDEKSFVALIDELDADAIREIMIMLSNSIPDTASIVIQLLEAKRRENAASGHDSHTNWGGGPATAGGQRAAIPLVRCFSLGDVRAPLAMFSTEQSSRSGAKLSSASSLASGLDAIPPSRTASSSAGKQQPTGRRNTKSKWWPFHDKKKKKDKPPPPIPTS